MTQQESKDDIDSFMKIATNFMFTQNSAKACINKFGDRAVAAMVKHYKQIDKGTM